MILLQLYFCMDIVLQYKNIHSDSILSLQLSVTVWNEDGGENYRDITKCLHLSPFFRDVGMDSRQRQWERERADVSSQRSILKSNNESRLRGLCHHNCEHLFISLLFMSPEASEAEMKIWKCPNLFSTRVCPSGLTYMSLFNLTLCQ